MALKKKKKRAIKKPAKKTSKKKIKKALKRTIKKSPARKTVKRSKPKKKTPKKALKKGALSKENLLGIVTHYFPHVRAAVIKLKVPLSNGESIKIKGHTTDFVQVVSSMQIDRVPITNAKKGDEIGLQVSSRVRQQDKVYKA
jgi:hypothetical protein